MIIELKRAWDPTDLGEDECILCEQSFVVQSVIARTIDAAGACPTCIEYFGRRNPQKFPTIEEYEGGPYSGSRIPSGPVRKSSSARTAIGSTLILY